MPGRAAGYCYLAHKAALGGMTPQQHAAQEKGRSGPNARAEAAAASLLPPDIETRLGDGA